MRIHAHCSRMRTPLATIALLLAATATPAQTPREQPSSQATVRFTVRDETAQPISGVSISVSATTGVVAGVALTDANGRAIIGIVSGAATYRYDIRKIGYTPISNSVALKRADTADVDIVLRRSPVALDTVTTTERSRGPRYSITGAELARLAPDAQSVYDALHRARPEMLGDALRMCPYIRNLWVNGRWIVRAPWDSLVPLYTTTSNRTDGSGRPALRVIGMASHASSALPLGSLKPEHVVEMHYNNCRARTDLGPRGVDALFVTLKPGIGYRLGVGTFVADSAVARQAGVIP